ncbi:hypothetical protein [Micromonospora sp. NPDC093277]
MSGGGSRAPGDRAAGMPRYALTEDALTETYGIRVEGRPAH